MYHDALAGTHTAAPPIARRIAMRLSATSGGSSSSSGHGGGGAIEAQHQHQHQVAQLEAENRELRRRLQVVADWATQEEPAAPVVPPPATASRDSYRVDVLSEGFWDGRYRARCGFRVIGIYDSMDEALDMSCMDFAMCHARIRPTRSSSSGASPAAAAAAAISADDRTGSAGSPMPAS